MPTFVLTLDGPEALATALADALAEGEPIQADAAGAFALGDGRWRAEAYFPFAVAVPALLADLPATLKARGTATRAGDFASLAIRPLDGTDWSAMGLDGIPPIAAGRFRVFGEHNRPAAAGFRRRDLVIEASTAFGTGDHASTYLALLALDRLMKRRPRPRRVLDVGTGTGILGLAVARAAPGARILASDIEPVAVRMAEANRRLNGVGPAFRTLLADGLDRARFHREGPYDLVLANILPDPLTRLAGRIVALMAPGGTLVLAGLRIGEAARLEAAYRAHGLGLRARLAAKEWAGLVLDKPGVQR